MSLEMSFFSYCFWVTCEPSSFLSLFLIPQPLLATLLLDIFIQENCNGSVPPRATVAPGIVTCARASRLANATINQYRRESAKTRPAMTCKKMRVPSTVEDFGQFLVC